MALQSDSVDAAIDAVERGTKARAAKAALLPHLKALEQDIITQLCLPTNSDQVLRFMSGQLAGLRRLEARLDTEDQQGQDAQRRRYG
jgi:hypothetical protein